MPPWVSAIILTQDRPSLLQRTIVSVLTQTVRDLELIVVMNTASEVTHRTVAAIKDPRFRTTELTSSGGTGYTRIVGARQAHALWIAFLKGTSWVSPQCTSNTLRKLERRVSVPASRLALSISKTHCRFRAFSVSRAATKWFRARFGRETKNASRPCTLPVPGASALKLSVIIPVHNGGENFRRCLAALAVSTRAPDELIVVDDASTDDSSAIARSTNARVIALTDAPRGPAFARNRGAAAATGDALVFFDADVAVHPDTLARIENYLRDPIGVAAVFGSYDDVPPARGIVTLYKNLLHHYVHQHSARDAVTFWAGCGAIRRTVFEQFVGFDEAYRDASIEDIELGMRMHRAGQLIWLCADVQVTHLKTWTLGSLLQADIFYRAVPWSRLIARQGQLPSELNLDWTSRASAVLIWIALGALGASWIYLGCVWISLAALAFVVALNRDLYYFFARRGGIPFAICGMGLHMLYFLYSGLVFGSLLVWHLLQKASAKIHPT